MDERPVETTVRAKRSGEDMENAPARHAKKDKKGANPIGPCHVVGESDEELSRPPLPLALAVCSLSI